MICILLPQLRIAGPEVEGDSGKLPVVVLPTPCLGRTDKYEYIRSLKKGSQAV